MEIRAAKLRAHPARALDEVAVEMPNLRRPLFTSFGGAAFMAAGSIPAPALLG